MGGVSPGTALGGSNLVPTVVTTKRRTPAPRTPARKPAARAKKKPAPPPPSVLSAHAGDLWAIGLITLGVLLALAIWAHALGPVGHTVDSDLAWLTGWARTVLPLVCAGAGVILLVERERPDPLRTGLGSALGLIGICGLAELAHGTPGIREAGVKDAGGWVGALVGHPLAAGIGTAGASVVFVALIIVAILIATGIALATCGRALRIAAGAVGSTLASWWKGGALDDGETTDGAIKEVPDTPAPKVVPEPQPFDDLDDGPQGEAEPAEEPTDGHPGQTDQTPAPPSVPVAAVTPRSSGDWKLPPLSYLP